MSDADPTAPADLPPEEADFRPDDIDGRFVPLAKGDVASVELDGELVLGRLAPGTSYLQTFALNVTASIVWQCFDGSGTLDEIVADLADAFGADIETVQADVLALTREVGRAGLLAGVEPEVVLPVHEPMGVPVGLPLPPFQVRDESNATISSDALLGRRTLFVNWSPTCGYCDLITGDLQAVQDDLLGKDIALILLATGSAQANRELLDRKGLDVKFLLQDGEMIEAFRGIGTPAAYLVDHEGTVVEPMAIGAVAVPELARRSAGHSEREPEP